jgi:hypothetical protein
MYRFGILMSRFGIWMYRFGIWIYRFGIWMYILEFVCTDLEFGCTDLEFGCTDLEFGCTDLEFRYTYSEFYSVIGLHENSLCDYFGWLLPLSRRPWTTLRYATSTSAYISTNSLIYVSLNFAVRGWCLGVYVRFRTDSLFMVPGSEFVT